MTNDHDLDDHSVLRRAHDELSAVVAAVADGERHLISPCAPWTVDDVIQHVVGGAIMAVALLGNADGRTAIAIRETWTRGTAGVPPLQFALALERAAFDVTARGAPVDHPAVPMDAADLLGQRIVEYAVHTWDIRRAVDDPTPLDAALARRAWQLAAPLAPVAAELGVFGAGPSGDLPPDAGDEARLVDVTGRRSHAAHGDATEAGVR